MLKEIAFTKVNMPYGWLGNMSPHKVSYQDQVYRTTEALFQCLRYEGFPEIQKEIRDQTSPMAAKMKAKKHRTKLDGRWTPEEREKRDLETTRTCLELKLERHPDLTRQLLATSDAVIIEDCSTRRGGSGMFWGPAKKTEEVGSDGETVVAWEGRNELGKMWMELREALVDQRDFAHPA